MTPIVLHHGLFGFGELKLGRIRIGYFHKIDRAIAERGHPVILSRVHPTGSIERRAAELKETILKQLSIQDRENERIVIIAHSMGGLDARYMIHNLGMADRVAALVTVCTPHRGTIYADWCMENLGRKLKGIQLVRFMRLDMMALSDLTCMSCSRFNTCTPNAPQVRYFSITGSRPRHKVAPILLHSAKLVEDAEGANDGIVSVQSGTWGENLGTWAADHLHVLNKRWYPDVGPDATGDITPRYLQVLDRLCELGLCQSRPSAGA